MQLKSLEDSLIHELNKTYNAEIRFLEAQQHMVRQIRNEPLIRMLVQHIDQTQQQIKNLRLVFRLIDREPISIASEMVTGLIAEAQTLMQQTAIHPEILQMVIVEALIGIENFEIICYRDLIKRIEQLGQTASLLLITENLQQKEQALNQFEQYFYTMPKSGTRTHPV